GTAIAGYKSHPKKACGKDRTVGCDPQIGETRDVVAKADCRTIHGGDQRHFDGPDRAHHAMNSVSIALTDAHPPARKCTTLIAHRFQVSAAREGSAGAGQNRAADVAVGIDASCGILEKLAVARLTERVARLGPVDRQCDDRSRFLKQECRHLPTPSMDSSI